VAGHGLAAVLHHSFEAVGGTSAGRNDEGLKGVSVVMPSPTI